MLISGKFRFPSAFLLLLFSSPVVVAQSLKKLDVIERSRVSIPEQYRSHAVQLPLKCGADGDIYVRFAGADVEPALTIISKDGTHVSRITLSKVPDFPAAGFVDFAPADNDVFLLAGKQEGPDRYAPPIYYLVQFKEDGSYESSVKLDTSFRPDFEPRQIAAFHGAQEFLVAGFSKGHTTPIAPFAAIFGADGQLQRELIFEKDLGQEDVERASAASNQSFTLEQGTMSLLDVTFLQAADDGNVYVMRHTQRGPVFVVSPGGVARRVSLNPPDGRAEIKWIMASGGSIATEYYLPASGPDPKVHFITITDVSSKSPQSTIRYTFDPHTTGHGMVCYQRGLITFLAETPEGVLQLVRASAE